MCTQIFVQEAIDIVGGGTKLARLLGVSPAVVTHWKLPLENKAYRQIPAERCPAIEQATGGLVRCEDLRPDVPWSVLRTSPTQPAQPAIETVAQGVAHG